MKYSIEYDAGSGVCVLQATGLIQRPNDSRELMRAAGDFAAQHGCSRFLFDMREAVIQGTMMDAYQTVMAPEKVGFSRHFRVAAVYPVLSAAHLFMENVGANRGASAFKVFKDFDAARKWITQDDKED